MSSRWLKVTNVNGHLIYLDKTLITAISVTQEYSDKVGQSGYKNVISIGMGGGGIYYVTDDWESVCQQLEIDDDKEGRDSVPGNK